ncbi:peptide ABC transporter substrate-binding protein [Clostridium sp. CS001]|uniref:peptide ABC transporter substrate-binding protein n=1 Tax=Clostridium sp. CS001 TaxID=2880648 RepID=UPI001CF2423B|nr:peptide ABC transporter substrate-binding protein [Clostridium sp. CS001]MCB2291070.1 peptide ABC transporter substrate-binding protein [Clostridium sp. CS001]
MKIKFKKLSNALLCFVMLLTINLGLSIKVNALPEKSLPSISSSEIIDTNNLLITTKNYEGMVQHQIFYIEENTKNVNWSLITVPGMLSGWTTPQPGANLTKIDLSYLKLKPSHYRFAIRVKRAGEKGMYSNKYGEYDDAYPLNFNLENIPSKVPQVLNTSINFDPRTLDISLATDNNSNQIISEIYEGLTRMQQREDGINYIAPAGAFKWECNENGDVWTFHLRDNYWSDGVKVTAQHYVDSILRSLDPTSGSMYSFLLLPIKSSVSYNSGKLNNKDEIGVKALDSNTLEITLEKPCPYFLELTYLNIMKPQRLDVVDKYKDTYGQEVDTLVCNGPFLPTSWIHQNKMVLEKNPYYWDNSSVKLQNINLSIIREVNAKMNEFSLGNIDVIENTLPEWNEKLQSTGKYNSLSVDKGVVNYTMFNQKDRYLKNSKIRKALILAENRTEKVKELYNGIAEPAYGFCPPSIQISGESFRKKVIKDPVIKLIEENKDPKALLIEGLKEIGENTNPLKMDITLLMSGTSPKDISFGEFMQKSYKDILGVDLKIQYEEWARCIKNTDEGKYQIFQSAWMGDYNNPLTYLDIWTASSEIFNTGFVNKEYDELILNANITMDSKERFEYLKRAEDLLIYEEGVISPSVFTNSQFFYKKEIKNLMYNNFNKFEFKYVEINSPS